MELHNQMVDFFEKPSVLRGVLNIAPPPKADGSIDLQGILVPASLEGPTEPFAHDDTGILLNVVSIIDGSIQALGSAFIVAPGLAITAAHVISAYAYDGRLDEGSLLLIGAYDGKLRAWSATRIRQPLEGDVALVEIVPRFVPEAQLKINHVKLSARLPAIGEPVLGLGLIAQANNFPFDPGSGSLASIAVKGLMATGIVQGFYPERDKLLPGPTLQCNFKAPGGMSGGPVFDKSGHVVGIISSSMEIEGEWVSWVSLHWHALMFEVQPTWPQGLYKHPGTLWPGHVAENWHLGIGVNYSIVYMP
jgi:S1-C subfamily serine protease